MKNRDFVFNGRIFAGNGRVNLYGSDFHFKYDEFKVDLNKIDSVQLSVPLKPLRFDLYNNPLLTRVKTVIESVTGELIIDDSTNKSGLRKGEHPEYPIFKSFNVEKLIEDRAFEKIENVEKANLMSLIFGSLVSSISKTCLFVSERCLY